MALVERRIGLVFAVFLALLILAALRAFQFGVVQRERLAEAATSQQVINATVPAKRGSILDRKGVELAVSQPADDIAATPYLIRDPARTALALSQILDVPEPQLLRKLVRRDTGFVYLARQVPGARAERVRRLSIEGIQLMPGYKRTYPRDFLASQVLGVVGTEARGLAGLEYAHERLLHGHDGRRRSVRDGVGDSVQVRDVIPSVPGADLQLTIDAAIQDRVEQVLQGVGATFRPKGATAVVMDPANGEVLALANWPRVDANRPAEAPGYANQNRAVGHTFEPGSTFKAITVAGALEDNVVRPDDTFSLPPQIEVADRIIGEAHERGPVTLTTNQILAQSSNVGAIKIGLKMGRERFDRWVRRFGFGTKSGIDLPGEERGIVPALNRYSGSSMGNLPIGQGLSVTPVQVAAAYAAIANGGILPRPHVVRRINGRRPVLPSPRRVISKRTSASLRAMLEGVFDERLGGTASAVHIPGYALAGKTGTANKIDPATGEYSKFRYVASFVGFAPARRPQLLISVMVDEPNGAIYGGEVAAPAFGKIASFALPYLKIAPQ